MQPQKSLIHHMIIVFFLLFAIESAYAIVLHPGNEPNLAIWTDRPDYNVVGRWGAHASCVAISRNCVITTKHQAAVTYVDIGRKFYNVEQILEHPTADLRLVKLSNANLSSFVNLYTKTGQEESKNIVIGGYGQGCGGIRQTGGITYGYTWDGMSNLTQRWCTNMVEETSYDSTENTYILESNFDGIGDGNYTQYEGTTAARDSGGGWFIYDEGQWRVAGLSRYVEAHFEPGHFGDFDYVLYESWFRNRENPHKLQPDYIDAVQLSSYYQWVTDNLPDIVPGDLTGNDWVDFRDFAVFAKYWQRTNCQWPDYCQGADSEPDDDVDWEDLAVLANNWLSD